MGEDNSLPVLLNTLKRGNKVEYGAVTVRNMCFTVFEDVMKVVE